MPYLTIPQASEATGKSEKTIRRLINKPDSKPYISKGGNGHNAPILIDANYLQNVYPLSIPDEPTQRPQDTSGQRLDTSTQSLLDTTPAQNTVELRHTIELLKLELRHKEELYSRITIEKDKRIEVLERSLLLLGEGQKREPEPTPTPAPVAENLEKTEVKAEPEPKAEPAPEPEVDEPKKENGGSCFDTGGHASWPYQSYQVQEMV